MRIVGGLYRHREIVFPDDLGTRPTKDRIRESIFSALGMNIVDKRCVDLFAGSGAYGLEAISRGAKVCDFIDLSNEAIKCIRENVKNLNINSAHIYKEDYKDFLINHINKEDIDVIFIDPPYKMKVNDELVNYLISNKILSNNAIIVLETDEQLSFSQEQYSKVKYYKYGFIHVTIIWR
ncbi:MAG: 16S rRNA (guanine(966)-N(2))-methyltransferase RsmD [Bacilli bacterium]|nr:16S rRNA (guanine(966)-N(2))-methyltransferase RsmD [Bacilli bacterium]